MQHEVTIGIPMYRAENSIGECLNSALAQSYPYIEFLVIDDASDDSSVKIVSQTQKEHPRGKNIRIIQHSQNAGIGETRNHLIGESKTKYFFFLDADDIITENAIELLHDAAEANKADMVYGSYEQIDMTTVSRISSMIYKQQKFLHLDEFPDYVYRRYNRIQAPIWNILINLEWFRNTGLRFLPINYWEDFALTMDLASYTSRVILLSDVTYYYRRYTDSLSNTKILGGLSKELILKNIGAIDYVKQNSGRIMHKSYFSGRMLKVMMTDFYIVCYILKNKDRIHPSFSKRELRDIMKSPLNLKETLYLKDRKIQNLLLYLLGVFPSSLSIGIICILGKYKKLI